MKVQIREEGQVHHHQGTAYTKQHGPFDIPEKSFASLKDKVMPVEKKAKKKPEAESKTSEEKEDMTYPVHVGGGHFDCSDGERFHGKEAALAHEQELTDDRSS